MDITYHVKDLAELAGHFEDMAKALRSATSKRKGERLRNEALAEANEHAAKTIRRTVLDKS